LVCCVVFNLQLGFFGIRDAVHEKKAASTPHVREFREN
jgi:hypothetical protein